MFTVGSGCVICTGPIALALLAELENDSEAALMRGRCDGQPRPHDCREGSPQPARPHPSADDSHSVASSDFYPNGMAGSWGRDSLLAAASVRGPESVNSLELPQEAGRDIQGGAVAPLPPLARGGSSASRAIPVPQPKHSASVGRSLGSQSSINNDSLGLEQRHIFDHFFDQAAHGCAPPAAARRASCHVVMTRLWSLSPQVLLLLLSSAVSEHCWTMFIFGSGGNNTLSQQMHCLAWHTDAGSGPAAQEARMLLARLSMGLCNTGRQLHVQRTRAAGGLAQRAAGAGTAPCCHA